MAYTVPVENGENITVDVIRKSLWTMTIAEVIKFTLKTPYAFVGGLNALSELLPLHLPVQTHQVFFFFKKFENRFENIIFFLIKDLTDEELDQIRSKRQLWAAHLLPLSNELKTLIGSFAPSTFHPLQLSLRRFLFQLIDLAPSMAICAAE